MIRKSVRINGGDMMFNFDDSTSVAIGCILFENKSGEELYEAACELLKVYNDSKQEDKTIGQMALEVAVAAYFEGCQSGAALALFCMLEGIGREDLPDSRILYDIFSEAGAEVNYQCAYNMGAEYERGNPPYIIANPYIASLWYKKAADAGSQQGQLKMGNRYFDGIGVEINFQLAELYWEAAAKQGNIDAQYNLGCLYDGCLTGGSSVACFNPERAGYWLEQAARGGHKEAVEVLNQSYRFNQRKNIWQKIN